MARALQTVRQISVGCYCLLSRASKHASQWHTLPNECGACGHKGLHCLVEDEVSVKGGTQRGCFLGSYRTSSGNSDVEGIEQRLSVLGSGEEMLRGENGGPGEGTLSPGGLVCAGPHGRHRKPFKSLFPLGTICTSFQGLLKKLPETRWLNTTKSEFLMVLGFRSLLLPPKLQEGVLPASSSLCWPPASVACGSVSPSAASICSRPSPLCFWGSELSLSFP